MVYSDKLGLSLYKGHFMGKPHGEDVSDEDKHFLDGVFYYIGSRGFMLLVWLATIVAGCILSQHFNNWTWLSRFGAIGIMIGTLLTLSPLFRQGIYLSNAIAVGFGAFADDGKVSATTPESRKVSNNIVIGVALIIISTAINAFGDLITSN